MADLPEYIEQIKNMKLSEILSKKNLTSFELEWAMNQI